MNRRSAHKPRSRPPLPSAALIARLRAEIQILREEIAGERQKIQADLEEALESMRELKFSRERYAALFDFSPAPYVMLDGNGFIRKFSSHEKQILAGIRQPMFSHSKQPVLI
ncbi:MAG TPA: hypothetical protein VGY56_08995 [Verrucomicrobiae bacterium]|nr:hypothetical protein [Verrucomicrobiae bacterium]